MSTKRGRHDFQELSLDELDQAGGGLDLSPQLIQQFMPMALNLFKSLIGGGGTPGAASPLGSLGGLDLNSLGSLFGDDL